MLNPDISLSGDLARSTLVLYRKYCIQNGNLVPRFSLVPVEANCKTQILRALRRMLHCQYSHWGVLGTRVSQERRVGYVWTGIGTGNFDLNTADTCGRGNFWLQKEKVSDSKISKFVWTGPKRFRSCTQKKRQIKNNYFQNASWYPIRNFCSILAARSRDQEHLI